MKIAFWDCSSGISGDMCLGALVDAGASIERIKRELQALPLSGWDMESEKVLRGGIAATRISVICDPEKNRTPRNYEDIAQIIAGAGLSERAEAISLETFRLLAEAEAAVHDKPIEKIHFHEVGAVDSIIDITGTAIAFCLLGIEKAFVSSVALGGGEVETLHGILPVPAPATVRLLEGFRVHGGPVQGELTTPTGAALLRSLAEDVDFAPAMALGNAGYGAGTMDFKNRSNTLRITVGVGQDPCPIPGEEQIWVLETNIDDMTGEEMGLLLEEAMCCGALDAFTCPVQMKKNRPGFLFTVLCDDRLRDTLTRLLLEKSSTLGVRYRPVKRQKLERKLIRVSTRWGEVGVKLAIDAGKVLRMKPEFDECMQIARREGLSLREVYGEVSEACRAVCFETP